MVDFSLAYHSRHIYSFMNDIGSRKLEELLQLRRIPLPLLLNDFIFLLKMMVRQFPH